MSIELNKPNDPNTNPSNESIESLGFLLILGGVVLDLANLLLRLWFNPLFILMVLAGWFILGDNRQRSFRGGIALLLVILFIFGGFVGRPLFHLVGLAIGISILIGSKRLDALLEKAPGGSKLILLLQSMKSMFKTAALIFLGALGLTIIVFFASRDFIKRSETKQELEAIVAASEKFKANTGRYPSSIAELIGNDPLKREWQADGWGKAYTFTVSSGAPVVSSTGSGSTINP
jgi:hypothetical protein